jgi:hypothetical protein
MENIFYLHGTTLYYSTPFIGTHVHGDLVCWWTIWRGIKVIFKH